MKKKDEAEKKERAKIQKQKEEAQKQLAQLKQQKQVIVDKKVKKMKNIWNKFEKTGNLDFWQRAQKQWAELETDGDTQPVLQADTKNVFTQSFKFEDLADNEFAQ